MRRNRGLESLERLVADDDPGTVRRRPCGLPLQLVREQPRKACAALDHAFWPDDVSLRSDEIFDFERVQGHHQITDMYLLALAVAHKGCLVTFDQAIALSSVRGAGRQHLKVL